MKTLLFAFLTGMAGMAVLIAQTEPANSNTKAAEVKKAEVTEVKPSAPTPKTAEIEEVKPGAAPVPKTAEVQAVKTSAPAPQEDGLDCRPVVEQLRQNVQKAPTHVLTLLEDAVIANGGHCVGDLVKAAIVASKADPATVKKIVFVAITNAPKQAPLIAEAAVEASPASADSVRAAFAEAFDQKNPRLKATDPAAKPAWEQAGAPVAPPVMKPRTGPAQEPGSAPAPIAPNPPLAAANNGTEHNPYTNIDGADASKWNLLHDGVVNADRPAAPAQLADSDGSGAGSIVPPPSLEEEKKKLSFSSLGFLVPKLPALPPVDEPLDLYFSSPFGGIPAP